VRKFGRFPISAKPATLVHRPSSSCFFVCKKGSGAVVYCLPFSSSHKFEEIKRTLAYRAKSSRRVTHQEAFMVLAGEELLESTSGHELY